MIHKILSSSLLRSAGVYTASNIVNSAVPFLLIPIFTRYLSPADYGIISMFQVAIGILGPIIGLSIHGSIGRQFVIKDQKELSEYIANCLLLSLLACSIVSISFIFFRDMLSSLSSIQKNWLWTIICFVLGQVLVQVLLVVWQMKEKAKQYAIMSFSQTIINAVLSLYTVVYLGMGWKGRIEAQVTASILFGLIAFIILIKQKLILFKYRKEYIFNAFSFGIPLIPHALGSWASNMIDKVFITNLVGIYDTGVYSVGYQIGMIISVLESSFIQAWVPFFYKKLKENTFEVKCNLVKLTYLYCFSLLLVALAVSLSSKYFMTIFVGSKFVAAHKYIIWIALGYAFNGMYKMMAGYFFYFEKTMVLAKITTSSSVINIILTYIMILNFGAIGAAYATTISFIITFIMTWCIVNKVNKMPWFSFMSRSNAL